MVYDRRLGAPAPSLASALTHSQHQLGGVMKEPSNQTEEFLLDLEKRAGIPQESSEKLETQLKVLLVQQSQEHAPDDLVAHTAKTLASCLRSRGDWAQAEQYALMAANLERRQGGARPGGDWRVHSKINQREADLRLWQERVSDAGTDRLSFGQSLRRLWRTRRGLRFGAWGWVLKRERP